MTQLNESTEHNLRERSVNVAAALESGIIDVVDEAGVTRALRGLTRLGGRAVQEMFRTTNKIDLTLMLRIRMGEGDDYNAAIAYLSGNMVEGARYELSASLGFFNDDEARIEETMRALSPEQLAALGNEHADVLANVRSSLDGTDLSVFSALQRGNYALADAYRLRDKVDEARRSGETDAVHTLLIEYTSATATGYGGQEISAEERRAAVIRELGGIVAEGDTSVGTGCLRKNVLPQIGPWQIVSSLTSHAI